MNRPSLPISVAAALDHAHGHLAIEHEELGRCRVRLTEKYPSAAIMFGAGAAVPGLVMPALGGSPGQVALVVAASAVTGLAMHLRDGPKSTVESLISDMVEKIHGRPSISPIDSIETSISGTSLAEIEQSPAGPDHD